MIYTRAMFEQFGQMVYKWFAYCVEEIQDRVYKARHTIAARREKRSRVKFEVKVLGDREEFDCERGLFACMGILCGHALKVMDYVGVTKVLKKIILKRWMKDARDLLLAHLRHYQQDESKGKAVTFKHSTLNILAMERVRLGDASSKILQEVGIIVQRKSGSHAMAPFENARDGLGLEVEDRMTRADRKRTEISSDCVEENPAMLLKMATHGLVFQLLARN